MAANEAKVTTENSKVDLFEDDDEFEEFETNQDWDDKEGNEVIEQWEDDWDDDDVSDDFSLQLRRELESSAVKSFAIIHKKLQPINNIMDSNLVQDETQKSSSEESNNNKLDNDDNQVVNKDDVAAGTTRSYYECVFCKRGFTTAQALGGHMNIHRRDRATRVREQPVVPVNVPCSPPPMSSGLQHTGYAGPGFPSPATNQYSPCQMYFPPSRSTTNITENVPTDWCTNLSLNIGTSSHTEESETMIDRKDDELDLELRLGHNRNP